MGQRRATQIMGVRTDGNRSVRVVDYTETHCDAFWLLHLTIIFRFGCWKKSTNINNIRFEFFQFSEFNLANTSSLTQRIMSCLGYMCRNKDHFLSL